MKKVEEQSIRDFIELKIDYKQTGLEKILKGYDENSGESILEDKVYYSINELDVYVNGIKIGNTTGNGFDIPSKYFAKQ